MSAILRYRKAGLEAVHFAMDVTLSQLSRNPQVAAHTKISCNPRPQHGSAAAGENQE
jgi:hypothetical protein